MRDILELCVRMDELADRTYSAMARACTDPKVAGVLRAMAVEEVAHVGWWKGLLAAWDDGLLPDIYADSDDVRAEMTEILASLEAAVPDPEMDLSGDEALSSAVTIEFFMLDAIFGTLLDLAEPAVARERHEAYSRHIERLIAAVEEHFQGKTMAGLLARVLRRSWRENRALAKHAMHDPLTGLANRRAFCTHALQWTAWSARYGHPLALLLLDIDNFKTINDSFGHAAGDSVLTAVAAAIGATTRSSDMASRYGGDEFAIVAPETGLDDARDLAGRLRKAVRSVTVTLDDGTAIRATVSIGIGVMMEPPGSMPHSLDDLLATADHALYAAKQSGRDRVSEPELLAATY